MDQEREKNYQNCENRFEEFINKGAIAEVKFLKDKTSVSINQFKGNVSYENYFSVINNLIKKDVVQVYEFLKNKYSEKLISKVKINQISESVISSLKGKQLELYNFLKSNTESNVLSDLIKHSSISRSFVNNCSLLIFNT